MSQEPWPCYGEDPWLSSEGRTMRFGKAVLGSHGPSSIVWSENGQCCGTIAYFVGRKEGRIWFNIIRLKLYQFERTTWWCLSILETILESILESALKYVTLKKYQKNNGLAKSTSSPPLGGRPHENSRRPWSLIHSLPCRTPCRLFIHEVFFGPLVLHLRVWSELGQSPPFRPMRTLRLQWSWAFSLVLKWPL